MRCWLSSFGVRGRVICGLSHGAYVGRAPSRSCKHFVVSFASKRVVFWNQPSGKLVGCFAHRPGRNSDSESWMMPPNQLKATKIDLATCLPGVLGLLPDSGRTVRGVGRLCDAADSSFRFINIA